MRILLLSDSHGNIYNIHRAINNTKNIDTVIHLGDCARDIILVRASYENIRFEYVTGNNDWGAEQNKEKILDIEGKKILITHGHLYNVKTNYNLILLKGKELGVDAIFFGHTHITEEKYSDGIILLNPGSIGASEHTKKPTYCVIEVTSELIKARFWAVTDNKA